MRIDSRVERNREILDHGYFHPFHFPRTRPTSLFYEAVPPFPTESKASDRRSRLL
jgi:hypothetical protein